MITIKVQLPTIQEQITQLFVIALWQWYTGKKWDAEATMSIIMFSLKNLPKSN